MNPTQPFVIWIDDEPNLLDAEMFELELHGFDVMPFNYPKEALDFFLNNPQYAMLAEAIIIDVLMPAAGDARLQSDTGEPVSVLLCEKLIERPIWESIREKITLYTRLPGGAAFDKAQKFAYAKSIRFTQKTKTSRIAMELIRDGVLSISYD